MEEIGDATGHPGGEILANASQHNNSPTCHVFAAVIANRFDYDVCSTVADTEPFACNSIDIGFAASGTVKCDIAGYYVLLWVKS